MNPSAFEDKLRNFKTVRAADYYKPRSKRTKAVASAPTSSSAPEKSGGNGKEAGVAGVEKSAGVFGDIEALCENTLPPAELRKFMSNLKAVHATAARRVNLNDLETLCSSTQ